MLIFLENGRIDSQTHRRDFLESRFVIGRLNTPEDEFDQILRILKNFWIFRKHTSTALRKCIRYFYFEKQAQRKTIFKPLRSSRADWHQHQKVGAQKLEKCEGRV